MTKNERTKMKTKHFKPMLLAAITLLIAGCASEGTTQSPQEQDSVPEKLTEFVMDDAATRSPSTRTTAEYIGTGLRFYWTKEDRLWVNDPNPTPTLKQDIRNDLEDRIKGTETKTPAAKFYFAGTLLNPQYNVRYTGKGNTQGNVVTIKSVQNQENTNDGTHISIDGDCGTAFATRATGRFRFELEHKSSYITFLPYSTQAPLSSYQISKIKITANKAVAGNYILNDNGLDANPYSGASATIEINLGNSGNGFPIPTSPKPEQNCAIMVIAPGTYATFSVQYTVSAYGTPKGQITRDYTNVTFTAGKNKLIQTNLQAPVYPFNHHEFSETNGCPNANEIYWYAQGGDPRWDDSFLWIYRGQLGKGGMWFKRKAYISGYNVGRAPDGRDYTTHPTYQLMHSISGVSHVPPTNKAYYFYLPALGIGSAFGPTGYNFAVAGYYWSSTRNPYVGPFEHGYTLGFSSGGISLSSSARQEFSNWTAQ